MKNNKKGFTLAELLVVVAIIAVLVAIAIPVFSAATDKATFTADLATARANYAEQVVDAMTKQDYKGGTITITATSIGTGITNSNVEAGSDGHSYKVTLKSNSSYTQTVNVDSDVTIS